MGWLILAAILGLLLFFCYRAWKVWETRFANRHEFDPDYLAVLMAQREEINGSDDAPAPVVTHGKHSSNDKPRQVSGSTHEHAKNESASAPERRKQLLDTPAQEVYLRLQACTSGYPVMAAIDVAALITPVQTNLPRWQADFVICKKDFSPVVAIFLERSQTSLATLDHVESILRHARLRVLRWPVDNLPSREQMHAQIFKSKKS